jgi:HEAT repeat protein
MRSAIVKVFASIHHPEVVNLLLEGLHLPDPEVRSDIILIMGMFKDSTISHYIDPFLQDPHPKVRANTIIALWQFKKYRLKLLMPLLAMLESDEKEMKLSGIYTVGAIRAIQEIPRLLDFLEDEDLDVRRYAAIALAKMDNAFSVEALVYLVMHPDEETARKTKLMLSSVSVYTRKLVKTLMQQEITTRLWEKYGHTKRIPIEELGQADLKELLYYYELLDEDKEALKIKGILYGHKKEQGAYAALNG